MGVWRDGNFRQLWLGQTVSEAGDAITYLALPLTAILVLKASTFQVGLLTSLTTIAWLLFGLPSGAWADRIRRRPVLLAADCGRALLLASIPLALSLHALTIAGLGVTAFLIGTLSVLFDVAYPAYLPAIVDTDHLVEANGALQASAAAMGVAGPGLGGALIRLVGAPAALLADALSFVVSAVSIATIKAREPAPARSDASPLADIRAGFSQTMRHPLFRMIPIAAAYTNLGFAAITALQLVFFVRVLHLSTATIGVLFSLGSLGGVLGAILAGGAARRFGEATVLRLAPTIGLPFIILLPLASAGPRLALAVLASLAPQAGAVIFNTVGMATLQRTVAVEMLARTTASIRVLTRTALAMGAIVGGLLGSAVGIRSALWLAAGVVATAPLLILTLGPNKADAQGRGPQTSQRRMTEDRLDPTPRDGDADPTAAPAQVGVDDKLADDGDLSGRST